MTQGAMRLSHLLYDKETYLPVIHIFIGDRKSYIKEKNKEKICLFAKKSVTLHPKLKAIGGRSRPTKGNPSERPELFLQL